MGRLCNLPGVGMLSEAGELQLSKSQPAVGIIFTYVKLRRWAPLDIQSKLDGGGLGPREGCLGSP